MTIVRNGYPFQPYEPPVIPQDEALARGDRFHTLMNSRRSVRDFGDDPVPRAMIEQAILTASTSPSGAHQQPWTFVVVGDAEIKRKIRVDAEREERTSYEGRMSEEWRKALEPIGTDWEKPFLEIVPWIVVVFAQTYGLTPEGKQKHYYVKESVGIACGLFIASLHSMGLSTLTHTPSPMSFLSDVLERPENERPYLLFPIGYAKDAIVPELRRKELNEISVWK